MSVSALRQSAEHTEVSHYITLHYIIVIWQTLLSRATYIEVYKQNQGQVR